MRDSRTRLHLARKAFQHVAEYDMAISEYFSQGKITYKGYSTVSDLKYGANPHQEAVALSEFYPQRKVFPFNIVNGSAGYINLMDAVRAWELVSEASQLLGGGAVAASFKHTTPAGVAIDGNVDDIVLDHLGMNRLTSPAARAIARARDSDPLSSFGDMVAVSHIVDDKAALVLKKEVSDGIIAPGYTDKAYQILSSKKGGKYLMIVATKDTNSTGTEIHQLAPGIVLKQERNYRKSDNTFFKNVPTSFKDIPEKAITDLILANTTLKYTPSNSVAISLDGQVVGVGAGQQNRVDCVRLACRKAATWLLRRSDQTRSIVFREGTKRQDRINARLLYSQGGITEAEKKQIIKICKEDEFHFALPPPLDREALEKAIGKAPGKLCLASDAFFPFRDSIDVASEFGVKYVLQPGGSVADEGVIGACDEHGIAMATSGVRVFLH